MFCSLSIDTVKIVLLIFRRADLVSAGIEILRYRNCLTDKICERSRKNIVIQVCQGG